MHEHTNTHTQTHAQEHTHTHTHTFANSNTICGDENLTAQIWRIFLSAL